MTDTHTSIDSEDGRYRAVVETTVPGSPEQVWEMIATGPGVEAWFVPAEVDPGVGGRLVTHHGSFGESVVEITAWEPPRRLEYEEPDWSGDGAPVPPRNTEILLEAASGDTCVVRLSSGFLTGGDKWHDDIDGTFEGWVGALRNLRLYLTHFAGLAVTTLWVQNDVAKDLDLDDAGLAALRAGQVGDHVSTAAPAPALTGEIVARDGETITLLTTSPPGIVSIAPFEHSERRTIAVQWYLYGPAGTQVRAEHEPAWAEWTAALSASPTEYPESMGTVSRRELAVNGYTTFDQLSGVSAKELLKIHGVGPKAIRILREELATRELTFAGETLP